MPTQKPLTQEQAIETYTELQRRVSVGAYLELEHDGSYPPDDGTPESTTLESIDNLEKWAAKQGLEFAYYRDENKWILQVSEEPPDLVVEQMNRIESPGYNELGEDEPFYVHPEEEDEEEHELTEEEKERMWCEYHQLYHWPCF